MLAIFVGVMYLLRGNVRCAVHEWGLWVTIPVLVVIFIIALFIELFEQRRTGIERPLIRWNNDD
jgi:hypothetical protein